MITLLMIVQKGKKNKFGKEKGKRKVNTTCIASNKDLDSSSDNDKG